MPGAFWKQANHVLHPTSNDEHWLHAIAVFHQALQHLSWKPQLVVGLSRGEHQRDPVPKSLGELLQQGVDLVAVA